MFPRSLFIIASSFSSLVVSAYAGDAPAKVPAPLLHQEDLKTPAQPSDSAMRPASALPSGTSTPMGRVTFEVEHARDIAKALAAPSHRDGVDHSRVYWDQPGDGRIWARGENWKASFDARGASFIPFLGSSAPRDFPVRFELAHIARGGAELALTAAQPEQLEDAVSIERGALREEFHAVPDALEQTFVFNELPGEGDLVLEIATASELAQAQDSSGGFRFDNDLGGVRYGRATAVDANGERVELADELVGHSRSLRVPASFLAHAALPLTIDPVIQTNFVTNGSAIDFLPDIAADGINLQYMVVYEQIYSQSDTDVYAVSTDGLGNPIAGTTSYIDFTTDEWAIPKIAYNALHQEFLCAAQVIPAGDTHPYIRARARDAMSTNMYAQQTINGAEPGDKFYVDVGGDPVLAGPTYFFVAWTRNFAPNDWDIHARLVNFDGTPLGTSVIYLENSTAFDWHPRVSKTDGREPFDSQMWNITWMREPTNTYDEVWGAQVRWDGTIINGTFDLTSGFEASYPVPSSPMDITGYGNGPRPYGVSWFAGGAPDHDCFVGVWQGTVVQAAINLNQVDGGDITQDQTFPEIDCDGAHLSVSYLESYAHSTTDFDAYVSSMVFTPGQIQILEGHQNFDFSAQATDTTRITGMFTSIMTYYPYFGLTWNRTSSNDQSDGIILAGMYSVPSDVNVYCGGDGSYGNCPCSNNGGFPASGCPNSATSQGASLYLNGQNFVSADTMSLGAVNMPATATCLFFQGTAARGHETLLADGLRCAGGSLVRLGAKVASSGMASYPGPSDESISLRGHVPASGGYRYYQTWYRDPHGTCSAGTYNLTNGISVLWLP
jgi:hypothetical protein